MLKSRLKEGMSVYGFSARYKIIAAGGRFVITRLDGNEYGDLRWSVVGTFSLEGACAWIEDNNMVQVGCNSWSNSFGRWTKWTYNPRDW